MGSITLFWVARGLLILGLRVGRPCKLQVSSPDFTVTNLFYSVNWYQHNYPYVWAGARLVRDL